jgi:hypothetical protein
MSPLHEQQRHLICYNLKKYDPYVILRTHIRLNIFFFLLKLKLIQLKIVWYSGVHLLFSYSQFYSASADTCLTNIDIKSFPKYNALRKAMSKITGLWNKTRRSITAAKQAREAFSLSSKY